MSITEAQLKAHVQGGMVFNNEHNPDAEAFELSVDAQPLSTWDNPFKMFVNGELVASFKSFNGLRNRVERLVKAHDLQQVF